jgi:hypothetical protein
MPDRRLDRHAREDEDPVHAPVGAIPETGGMADAEDRLALGRADDDVGREAEGGRGGGRAFQQLEDAHAIGLLIAAQQGQQTAFRAGDTMQLLTELSKLKKSVGEIAAPFVRRTVFFDNGTVECAFNSHLGKTRRRLPCLGNPEHRCLRLSDGPFHRLYMRNTCRDWKSYPVLTR